LLTEWRGPRTECARVGSHDLTGHHPVEQHADAREVLLHGWSRAFVLQALDVGGDMNGLHILQPGHAAIFAPAQEVSGRAAVRRPRVCIADRNREEFEETQRGPVSGIGDQRRKGR
jgi:hypothetical protein